jgi:hypothetical protein
MGLEQGAQFSNYHRVLNRNIWSSRWLSRHLFRLLVDTFVPSGDPVVIGLDDTIERRWGGRSKHAASIETRSVSSHGHFGGQRSIHYAGAGRPHRKLVSEIVANVQRRSGQRSAGALDRGQLIRAAADPRPNENPLTPYRGRDAHY